MELFERIYFSFIYVYIYIVVITNSLRVYVLLKFSQILQQDSRVFEMMTLAQDMGMDKLKLECEDYVISTIKGRIKFRVVSFYNSIVYRIKHFLFMNEL